ncbi:hypothetical protein M9Y10_040908 [Tritrichomonas musculus]|uniref:Uncharacterized protein n=1 Tax=Tritrichomonas musculus TaxID=1915356 RepID=A0ABR2K2X9_9EUKA
MQEEENAKAPKKQYKPAQEMINLFIGTEEEKAAFNPAISQGTFSYAVTFNQQLGFLCKFFRSGSLKVKYRQIGSVFAVSKQKAQKSHIKFLRGEGIDGRPPILTPDELQIIEEEIKKQYQNSFYPTVNEITQFIIKNFKKNLFTDTLGRSINGLPIQFIFNIDEMGVSEFEDGGERTVIVPVDYPHSRTPYPISRSEKHATCLSCINLCGLFVHFFKQFKDLLLIQKYIII